MNNTLTISCKISTTDSICALGMEVWLDNQQLLDQAHVVDEIQFNHVLDDQDAEHELKFVLKGKQESHTAISESGEIVKDARLVIKDLAFDSIQLGHVFTTMSIYEHNFNGTGQTTQEKFYGEMGCNGTLTLKFSTPIYLWLLENM